MRDLSQSGPKVRRVTLKDIARETGYSINTVSHALKDKDDISRETKEYIRQTAQKMGYIVDSIAGSLRTGFTHTIAVIVGDIFNPYFGMMVRDIQLRVFEYGYSTIMMNTNEDEKIEYEAIVTAIAKRVDGIIICPTQKEDKNIELLRNSGIPYVLLSRRYENSNDDYVVCDDIQGGYIATRYLLENGHKRILLLNGPFHISSARERLTGYYNAHIDSNTPYDPKLVREVGIKFGGCSEALKEIASQGISFSAVFAFNDVIALEAMHQLKQMGKEYSEIPVVGFDNVLGEMNLPVSMISVDSEGTKSEWAARILLQRMEERRAKRNSSSPMQIVLKVKLARGKMSL